jgi:hypothetical protein
MNILKLVTSPPLPVDAAVAIQIHDVIQSAWAYGLSQQHTDNFLHDALSAATQFNCRQLLGRVYYTYLARIKQSTYTVRAGTAGPIPRVSGSMFRIVPESRRPRSRAHAAHPHGQLVAAGLLGAA